MDIKKFLQKIGIDEEQVDMSYGLQKTSDGFEILTKDGAYRTYSDSSFENNFKLSRIKKNNTESFFRDVKYLNEQGEETSLRVADHRHKGKNLGYSTDIEGKHIIPKQNIDILENPEMSEIEYMKSMEEDILSRIAYRNRRSKAGTLKGHTGKERVSIVPGAEVDKIIQQIYDVGEVSPELAKRGFELIKQRKKNSQVAEKSMNRVYYDIEKEVREEKKYNKNALQTVLDRIGMAEKDYRELQKNVRDAAKSTAINDNAKRDTEKIFKAINKDATMDNMQKKIQKKASNLSKIMNDAFAEIPNLEHTITNKRAAALEAIRGTAMHGYSTKGLWRMGAESKIAPIKSPQKTVSKDFAREIRAAFENPEANSAIYTNSAQHHNVGKNNYYNVSIDKAKEVLKNGKGLFFDYETTGQRGTKTFAPLQFSARWTDDQGVSQEQEYLIQMTKEQTNYIDNLISRIQDLEYNPSKLSEDERRDLLSMTNYTMGQDGKVKAKHIEYAKNVDLANKELQAKIKEGRDLMSAENKNAEQIGLVASNKWEETLQGFARTHADKIWTGHNNNTFDTPLNETYGVNIKNTFDMLDFARQYFKIGHKNAKGEMLLAHNLGALGKHFGVDMDAIGGGNITQHTGSYDTAFTKAVLEKMIQEAKVSNPTKSQNITANEQFGFVKKGYFRGAGDEFSFKTNAGGDLIDQNAWGDMLLKKGSGYIFGGTIQKEVKGMMRRFSKYTNIETGDESFIYLNDGQTADTILSNQFEDVFHSVGEQGEILGEIANKTAILSMFDSSSGWYNLKAMNGGYNTSEGQKNRQAKLTPQAKEVFNFISEQIGAKAANLPAEAKSLMLGEIGDKIGIQHYKRYNSGDFHRDLLGDMSNLSLGNTKSILKSFVETNKKSFKKGFVKDFNRTINNLDLTEDSFKHRDGQSAIYGLTRLMYNNLNDNFFADKNSASSIGNFENLKADSKELSNIVDSVISDYNMRYGANPVDTLYNDAPKILQDLLSGQDTKERLKKTGWNMSEEFSDLYDGLGKKDGKFGRNSVGETLKKVSDYLAKTDIENGGIHSVLRANPNGRGFRFGVFAPGKAHEIIDRDGNLLFDKMAGYVDVEMGENGSIKINGMEKANHLLPMYSKESGTTIATLREGYFKAMLEGMTSDENRKRILSGEAGSIMSSLRWYGEQFLERSAGSTYKSTEAEGVDSVSAGGPIEKMFSKSNMMDLEKYLFDAALGAGYTREEIGYGYDRENMFSALMDYYTNISLGTESILENTKGFYLNTKEGLKNGRYEKRDALKEILRKVATAKRVDMATTRQGAYLTGRLGYGGAHNLIPFALMSSEQSRAHDQFYNYVPRMRSQQKRNAAYKKGLTLKSHVSTPMGLSEFGNDYYNSDILDKFTMGTTTDSAIASVYSNLETLLQQDIEQGIITQKEADQISKEFKNNPYASVHEGSAIMSKSMYDEISNNLYETVTKEINAKDIDTLKGQFGKTIKTLNYGDAYNVEDGKLKRALKLSKINLDEGDILHAIERTDDGRYQAVFGKKYRAGLSSKGVSTGGDRVTVGTIMKDIAAKFLFRHTGNEGASMVSDYSPKATNLGNFIGGRLEFMIDKYWAEAEKSGMKTSDIKKNIQSALDKTSILGKAFKWDKDSSTFSQNLIYTNDGFQYYDNNGNLVPLVNSSDDINALVDEDYGYDKDNISGRKGDLEILGRELFKDESLFGKNYYEKTKNLVAQSFAISNLYGTKEAIGSGLSEKELALSSKFKLGLKEKNAIKTTLNSAKIANKDLSFSGLEKYFESYFGGKDPNAVAKESAFNRAWKDTALLSKTREDKDALLQNRLTSENGAVDLSNIVEIVAGKATQRNQISIADLYTSDEANYTGVMSEKDFEKTSAGRLLSFVKGLGISPENARIIARTGEDIEIHNNWGRKATKYRDKFNPVLSDIAIALTPALKNKDGEVLYGDGYKNLNALFKSIYDMSNPDADQRYKAENLRKAAQGYLNTLFSPQDKDSALFDELTKVPLESSMRGHTVGANIALGEKFDNVMMVNDQDLSKMLGSEADVNSDKFRKHISDLLTYYDKSFGTKYSKNITDFDALDKKGRKQFEKSIIKDIIKKVDINNQSGDDIKSLFGLGHRYPSTYDETVMFQRLMVDKSLDRGTMRFGSGLATQMNADFDGDHTETALTLLNNLSAYSEEEQTQLFNEMRRITEQKDAERRLLGDWTRRKSGMVWDDATSQWIDPTSIEDKAMSRSKKMQKFGAMRENPQNEAISGWLSKRNFGNIGQFSTLSTKFRDATRKFEKDPSKNIMTGMARAMYEITEQDSISAKKVGERLMLKNQGADFNATMENIIHGIELFRSQLMTYSGSTKDFVDNISKTGSEIGFFGEKGSNNFIESRQMAAVVARMQTLIDSKGTSDEDRAKLKTAMKRYGATAITTGANRGEGGYISYEGFMNLMTDVVDSFGGVKQMQEAINAANGSTRGSNENKIGKYFEREIENIEKGKHINAPFIGNAKTATDETSTGSGTPSSNNLPEFSVGTLTVGTINAGSIVSGTGIGSGTTSVSGSGLGKGTGAGSVNGLVSGAGEYSNYIQYPDSPLDIHNPISVDKHARFARNILREKGLTPYTAQDIKEASMKSLRLVTKDGKHDYFLGTEKIVPDATGSQLGSIMDVTAYRKIDSQAEKLKTHIEELYSGNTKFTINNVESTYDNIEDLVLSMSDIGDTRKMYQLSKAIGSAKKGDLVHKIEEALINNSISRDDLTLDGVRKNKDLAEDVKSYEEGMRRIGQGGYNSNSLLQGVIENASAMYDIKANILGKGNLEKYSEQVAEKSFLLSFGKEGTPNQFRIAGTVDNLINNLGALDWKNENAIKSNEHIMQLAFAQKGFRSIFGDANGDAILNSIIGSFTGNKNFKIAEYKLDNLTDQQWADFLNMARTKQALGTSSVNQPVIGEFSYGGNETFLTQKGMKAANDFYKMMYQLESGDSMELANYARQNNLFSVKEDLMDAENKKMTFARYDEKTGRLFSVEALKGTSGNYEISTPKEEYVGDQYLEFSKKYHKLEMERRSLEQELANAEESQIEDIKFRQGLNFQARHQLIQNTPEYFLKVANESPMLKMADIYSKTYTSPTTGAVMEGSELFKEFENLNNALSFVSKSSEWYHNKRQTGTFEEQDSAFKVYSGARTSRDEVISRINKLLEGDTFDDDTKATIRSYLDDQINAGYLAERGALNNSTLQETQTAMNEYLSIQNENNRLMIDRNGYLEQANKSFRKSDKDFYMGKVAEVDRTIEANNLRMQYRNGMLISSTNPDKPIVLSETERMAFQTRIDSNAQQNQMKLQRQQIAQQNTGLFGKIKGGIRNAVDYMVGYSLGYSIIGMVKQAVSMTIQQVMQLNKTMTDLAIVTGKNVSEMRELVGEYNNLAKQIGLTNAEVNASANEWLRMGYKESEINTLIKNTAMLSKLGMIEMGEATQYMTSAIKGYGVAVQDSMQIVDMATSLDMKYAVSAGYILEAMSRTATSAKLAKVEMSDLQAMIAVIGETSQKDASVVGESLKTAFARYGNVKAGAFLGNSDLTSLEDQYEYETFSQENADSLDDAAVNDIEKVLDKMDIDIRNGSEWRSYSDILEEVGKNFKNLSDYEKNAITTAMFGTRQRENGLIVLENYNKVLEAEKIAAEAAGSSIIKYEKYLESVEAAKAKVTTAYEGLILDIKGAEFIKDVLNKIAFALEHIGAILGTIGASTLLLNLPKVLLGFSRLSTLPMFMGGFFNKHKLSYDKMTSTYEQGYENLVYTGRIGKFDDSMSKYFARHGYNSDEIKDNIPWKDKATGNFRPVDKDRTFSSWIDNKVDKNPILSKIKNKIDDINAQKKSNVADKINKQNESIISSMKEHDQKIVDNMSRSQLVQAYKKNGIALPDTGSKRISTKALKEGLIDGSNTWDSKTRKVIEDAERVQKIQGSKAYNRQLKRINKQFSKISGVEIETEKGKMLKERMDYLDTLTESEVDSELRKRHHTMKKSKKTGKFSLRDLHKKPLLASDLTSEITDEEAEQRLKSRKARAATRKKNELLRNMTEKEIAKEESQAEKQRVRNEKRAQRQQKIQNNGLLSSISNGLTPADRYLNNYRKTMTQADYADAVGIKIKDLAKTRAGGEGASQAQIDEELKALNKMSNSDLFKAYTESGEFKVDDYRTTMAEMAVDERISAISDRALDKFDDTNWDDVADKLLKKHGGTYTAKDGTVFTAADRKGLGTFLYGNARNRAMAMRSDEILKGKLLSQELEKTQGMTAYDIEREKLKLRHLNKTGKTIDDATADRLMKREATVSSGINAASSMVGMMVGAQAGAELFRGFAEAAGQDEETWSMIGSAIGMGFLPWAMQAVSSSVGDKFGKIAGSLAGAGVGAVFAIGLAAWNKYKKEVEKSEKAQAEKVEKSQEKIEKYSSLDTQSKFERYDKLAKGVNQYGDNISLTDTEYEEFQTLGDELGDQFDNLVIGTDRFGHSLLGANDELGGLADASKELLEIEKKKLYEEKLEDPGWGDSLFVKAFEKYKDEKDDFYSTWFRSNPTDSAAIEEGSQGIFRLLTGENLHSDLGNKKIVKSSEYVENETVGNMVEDSTFSNAKNKKYSEKLDNRLEEITARYNRKYWNDNKLSKDEQEEQFFKVQHNGSEIEIILPDDVEANSEIAQDYINDINQQIELVNKESIKDFRDGLKSIQQEFTKEFLPAILNTNPIWEQLDDTTQSFVNLVASEIDLAANDINSADDYKTLIEDKILSPINKLTEEELLKFEQSVAAFADKEHLGIELTLSESLEQYNDNIDLVKKAYKNTDAEGYFGTIAKQMGYTYSKKKNEWTDEEGVVYTYNNKSSQWESADGEIMDDDIYAKIIGTNKAEDILDEITAITSNAKETDGIDRRQNLSNNLTLEEAQWVAKHSDKWIADKSSDEIIEAAQKEALTATGTMKSRIDNEVDDLGIYEKFEKLIDNGATIDEIKKQLGEGPEKEDFYKHLGLLDERAKVLGISLAEAYNQAKNLSSIDKFGMTTKTVQSIVAESENMMNIAMAVNQGSISGELLTYLQEHAPELLGYNGSELSAEIMKSLGTSTLIGASLKGTLSNSNAYFDMLYKESGIKTSDGFNDFIKNNSDMLKYQDYFKTAFKEGEDGNPAYYDVEGIKTAILESDEAKEWLEAHNITIDPEGNWAKKVAAFGGDILSLAPTVETEMKKAIADKIVKIDTHNVQQTHRAFKELTKNIRDLNEQLKDLEKQNAINKLNNELERLTINIDGLDKKISLFDWATGFLAEGDFEGKSKALEDNLSALADKNKDLSAAMAEVESKTPKSAEEAEALKQKYDELSSSYIENQKAILEVQKQMESLGVTMLSSAVTESFEALNKQMQTTSDYAKISNLRTYTGGATGLLNYNLSGTLESKSEVDKKRSQYETLLKMQETFNKQSLDLNKQYLDMKEKQDEEDYNKQKSDTAESIRDARVEFFQEHGHILQEKLGKDGAMAAVGITQQDINDYYSSKLNLDPVSIEETMKKVNDDFTKKEPEEEPSDKTPKGDKEPKAKTPTIEGTDAKVDTPESVSNHITETMKAGIEDANLEMAENSKDYGIKAPPLNDSSWGVTVTDGLGLKFRNAYIEIMKALNKYIENPDTQDAKLTSPPLKWSGKRGWENDLVNRMKTKTNEAIGKVNEYLTNGESAKLQAPKVDEKTWEKFGIAIGKYISDGIEYGTQLGFGNSLDVLLDSYDKNKNSGGAGSSSLASYSGGSAPISPNGIPVGATVYMNSPNTNGHVGIVGTDGRIYNMWNRKQSPNGSGVCAMTLQELANSKRTAISWGWNGGKELTREQALAVAKEAQSFKSYGKKPGSCQGWVASVYANAGVQKYTSKASATNAGKSWGKYNIPSDAYTAIGTSTTGDSSYLFPTNGLFGLEKVQNLFSYANGTKKSNKITKAIELALLSATAIPGVDTFANLGIAGLKLAEGSYGSAALALFSALPIVGELGDGVQYVSKAKKLIKAVSAVNMPIEIASAMSSSYADGSNGHPGGLALIGDEGLVKKKSGLFPELVILPNGEMTLMGTKGPVLTDLPKGTEVVKNNDTEKLLNAGLDVNSYAKGTDNIWSKILKILFGDDSNKLESIKDIKDGLVPIKDRELKLESIKDIKDGLVPIKDRELKLESIKDIKDGLVPIKDVNSYANGTDTHQGGLALIGDEGLVNNKSGLFPELVILPNGEMSLMGTKGPVLTNLPRGTEVLSNSDTEDILGVNSYADGTDGVAVGNQVNDLEVKGDLNVEGNENVSGDLNTNDQKYKSAIDDTLVENYKKEFTNMLDNIVGERETTDRILRDKYQRNNYKIPVLSEYERLENEATDAISRAEYNLLETVYATSDDALDYKQLANYAKKKNEEAQKQLGIAISEGKPLEVVQAWSKIVEETQAKVKEYEESIQAALDATLEAFSNYATTADNIFNNIKDNLNADFENGWLGEKTSSNYYNPLKEAADERIKNISDAYNGALQEAINKYLELGFNIDVATSKAMEEDVVKELQKSRKNAIRERTQVELDENNDRIANYERANQKIKEQLGYNSNLSNSQFRDVYTDTLANTQDMIAEDIRALKDIENLSPKDQKAVIDRLNKNIKAQIDITSTYIDNILNKAKRLTDASINERDKQLSVGGITTYDENGNSIFEKNIEDFKEKGEAIAQAIADTRYNLAEEARYNGLTDAEDIEEYINKHESMISLNEQHLDNLKKQAEEHKKIRDYTLEQLNNEKKLLDLSKENEWASKANIQNYYDAVDESLDAQIAAQKKYLESKNLSEEEYRQTKMAIAELEREKHNNALQRMQDTQAYYEKEYSAMTYMVNEYITALSDEKETISETYDEEIDKLQQVNNAKERSIKLTELQNALENAQNEKKRVYRAGVGFVYEQDREAVKKAKDELDAFYRQDQIDNLTKAKEMETKILDERIEKWNKYLDAMEKVYKTAERNHNIGILENLLGVEGWQGVFNELNSDMSDFVKKYDDGMKIYHGEWTGFLEEYEKLSTKIYDKLESSVELLKNIKEFGTSNTAPADKNVSVNEFDAEYKDDNIQEYEDENRVKSWKDKRWRNQIRDFSALYSTEEGRAIADKWDISKEEAHLMHLQKKNELLSFVREYGYEDVFKILSNEKKNDTKYSISELKDAFALTIANKVDLGELTQEEGDNASRNVNRNNEYKKALEEYHVVNKLLYENVVDLSEWINVLEDGSAIQLYGIDFTKEELERIRAEKIWMNYRKGTYGDFGDVNTIEHVKDIIDNTFREEDKGTVGTDQVGMFIDTFIDNISGSINTDKVSDRLQQLLGQIVKEDIIITDEYDIFDNLGATSSILEYESLANNNGSVGSTFNLHNYYIARGENPVGNIIDAAGQMTDITNKK